MKFTIYNSDNAPEASRPLLAAAEESFGFLPNLLGEFAESPAVLEGYLKLDEIIGSTDFTAEEQQLAILAASVENRCHYCSAAHSTVLKKQLGVDDEIVDAVRRGQPVPDEKLNALVNYVRTVVSTRGFPEEVDIRAFLDAGYSKRNVLEVNLIVAFKTISNYTNHLANTPVDVPFTAEKLEFQVA